MPREVESVLLAHPTLVLGSVAAALVILRALQFTEFQLQATLAVLSTGGFEGVILASVAAILPILAPLTLAGASIGLFYFYADKWSFWAGVALWLFVFIAVPLTFFITPVGFAAIPVLIYVFFVAGGDWNRFNPIPLAAILFGTASLVASGAWLPAERIRVGSDDFLGYVLEETADWTTILRLHGVVVIPRTSEIVERTVCERQLGLLSETPWTLIDDVVGMAANRPPPCPAV